MRRDERRYIQGAADQIQAAMLRRNGGAEPSTIGEVHGVARAEGLELEPIFGRVGFRADLIGDHHGKWKIRYNADEPEMVQMVLVWHEIAEYLAIADAPGLFDDDPGVTAFAYDGGLARGDFRHLAAIECEKMLVASLHARGLTVPDAAIRGAKSRSRPRLPEIVERYGVRTADRLLRHSVILRPVARPKALDLPFATLFCPHENGVNPCNGLEGQR